MPRSTTIHPTHMSLCRGAVALVAGIAALAAMAGCRLDYGGGANQFAASCTSAMITVAAQDDCFTGSSAPGHNSMGSYASNNP